MKNDNQSAQTFDYTDEIDLRKLFSALWNGKWLIISVTSIFAILSIIIAIQVPNQYKSYTTLAPAQGSNGSLSGAMASPLGGLVLTGVNFGQRVTGESQIALEIMQSWGFIEEFIEQNDLAVELAAVDGWNRTTNQLEINDNIYNVDQAKWVSKQSNGETSKPSSWALFKSFSNKLTVSQDNMTGMIIVSIDYYSPIIAKQWVELFVGSINNYMRLRKLSQVNTNIEYLQAQITKTSITEMKEVFYQIIEEQTKIKMLAAASPEYAFVTVSEAMVPQEKSQPTRSTMVIIPTLLGGILSMLLVLILHYYRKGHSLKLSIE